jgi:glycine/D-amino acid oxidase-like deaminating enzyme
MRIAIIGGGLGGCLTALELARRGFHCEIFERNERELAEASFHCEGKVHLGLLYAHELGGATSRLMVEGAVSFRSIVTELTGFDVAEALSTPFLYAVHHGSLVSPEAIDAHFGRCSDHFAKSARSGRWTSGYVDGASRVGHRRLDAAEWSDDLDPDAFSAVFETSEFGVDPRRLAAEVSRAVRDSSSIELHVGVRIETVVPAPLGRWSLSTAEGRIADGPPFEVVVNASWSDLLRIDRQVGLAPPPEWSYRFKLGNRVARSVAPGDLLSVTVVLGAYGDIVNYGQGGVFLSWYPSGRLILTDEIDLPDWNGDEFRARRDAAYEESRVSWESMSAKLRALEVGASEVDTRGGMILAAGRLDVNDRDSPLHSRLQVGLEQAGSYISLNTGKYTLAPLMARRAADRVEACLPDARAAGLRRRTTPAAGRP